MRLTAQFKVLYTKEFGDKIDLIRFSADRDYAKLLLARASQSNNETLLVIAMQLMQLRGLIAKTEKEPQGADDKINQKCTGRLR